jgi:hypothetical protein
MLLIRLKRLPADLNRRDSHKVTGERVFATERLRFQLN